MPQKPITLVRGSDFRYAFTLPEKTSLFSEVTGEAKRSGCVLPFVTRLIPDSRICEVYLSSSTTQGALLGTYKFGIRMVSANSGEVAHTLPKLLKILPE